MKKLLCSVAAVTALLWMSAVPSSANTCTGTCSTSANLSSDPVGATFNDVLIGAGKKILDEFDFTLTAPPLNYSTAVIDLTLSGSIKNFVLGVFTSGGVLVEELTDAVSPVFATLGPFDLTAPGSYYVEIAGTAVGSVSYGGSISAIKVFPTAPLPTPLPGALGLFAGGLGLLGFAGLRKRSKNRVVNSFTATA
jgi:hypothetical protein